MNQLARISSAASVALVLVAAASPAQSQDIRRYGDESGGSSSGGGGGGQQGSRMVYPGQPMPESGGTNQATRRTRTRRQSGDSSKKDDAPAASYSIRIHEPGDFSGPRRAKKQTRGKTMNRPPEKMYRGVIPGKRDSVSHLKREVESTDSGSETNRLTWVGFQPEDQRTRVFLQTASEPKYSTSREDEGRLLVIRLEDTEISAENFRRHVDTSKFRRVTTDIRAGEEGDATIVRIKLRRPASPTIERSGNYLYVDFPHESPEDDASSDGEG